VSGGRARRRGTRALEPRSFGGVAKNGLGHEAGQGEGKHKQDVRGNGKVTTQSREGRKKRNRRREKRRDPSAGITLGVQKLTSR